MNIQEMNIACIQLWASGEIKMRYWDEEVRSFLDALSQTPGFVYECEQVERSSHFHPHLTLFTRVQFALVFIPREETTRSPFFFLEDIRDFVKEGEQVKLVLDGASFTISEKTAAAFKVLKEGTEIFDWKKQKARPTELFTKKVEVLRTPKFCELKGSVDKLLEEKIAFLREQRYDKAGEIVAREKELWQQIEQMMLDACSNLVKEDE